MRGREGPREREYEGARVRGREGARERVSEGARERGNGSVKYIERALKHFWSL